MGCKFASAAVVLILASPAFAGPVTLEAGPFTKVQADAGRAAYAAHCAVCHRADLSGANLPSGIDPVPLAGSDFMSVWSGRMARNLYDDIRSSMPYGNGGSLSLETYRQIVAFILEANGARPGVKAFGPDSNARIGTVADGKLP